MQEEVPDKEVQGGSARGSAENSNEVPENEVSELIGKPPTGGATLESLRRSLMYGFALWYARFGMP